jgi:hypothetical protein
MVCADASRPQMVDSFTKKTFTAMSSRPRRALAAKLIVKHTWT